MFLFESLLVALSTYSAIPVPQFEWNDRNMKYAICCFPVVGLFCGAALLGWSALAELFGISDFFFAMQTPSADLQTVLFLRDLFRSRSF